MHALKVISDSDEQRQSFIDDLELLLGDMLNNGQKISLITLMYKRYKFLK